MSESKRDRDRATEAFRRWALLGMPDPETIRKKRYKRAADLLACASVFAALRDRQGRTNAAGEEIVRAVVAIYMQEPWRPLRRGEVGARAMRFALENPADRSTVFRWLDKARKLWAEFRRDLQP